MHEEFIEDIPRRQSYLEFIFGALGYQYTLLLPLAALVSFTLVLVLILRGKGSFLPTALMLIVPLPVLVGLMGVVDGISATFQEIAMSSAAPKPSELARGIGMSLVTAWVGIWLAIPGFLLAATGSFIRALTGDAAPPSPGAAIQATIVEPKR